MESILDRIASSPLIMIVLYMVLIGGGIAGGIFLNPFKNKKKLRTVFMTLIILASCVPIFFISSSKNGLVKLITEIKFINDKIIFLDLKTTSDDYSTYDNYRIHIVDKETGEKLNRTLLGEDVVWLDDRENLILFQEAEKYILFDVEKLAIVREINNEYLMLNFSEFSKGVESITANKNCLTILAKDGKSYVYDIYTNKINVPCSTENIISIDRYSFAYDKMYINENGYQYELFTFASKNPNDLLQHIESIPKNKDDEIIVSQDAFISGSYIAVFGDKNIFLVMSFETTDKADFLITALNFHLETVWKLDYLTLNPDDFYSKNYSLTYDIIECGDNIIFGIGGFLYSVETKTGNIVWKNRF
jgi:hypothetical protein